MAWKFRLDDDYDYVCDIAVARTIKFYDKKSRCWLEIHQGIGGTSTIRVNKCYQWDGCSPKKRIGDLMLIGIPDGIPDPKTGLPKTYYASLVHDALYQFIDSPNMPFSRKEIDTIFRDMLIKADFSLANLYYHTVRLLGGAFRSL